MPARDKAKQFFGKVMDVLTDPKKDDKNDKPDFPPRPPPKPEFQQQSQFDDTGLVNSLQNLGLNGSGTPPTAINPSGFPGGFVPSSNVYTSSAYASAPALLRPLPMPMPAHYDPAAPYPQAQQSLTMQMALQPGNQFLSPPMPPRPHSTSEIPSPTNAYKPSISAPPLPSASRPIATKRKSSQSDSSSVPGTPSGKQGQVQCTGITKAGEQCTRMVKLGPPLAQILGDDDMGDPVTRFCFQHRKEVLVASGFYALTNGLWVGVSVEWIPTYLLPDTQAALLAEMKKPGSQSDVHGYIYTYEIRDPTSATVKLKVGRTTNIVRRLDQWGKQCGSKEPIPRGFYPGTVEYEGTGSLVKGMVKPGDKTPWIHRLERLIHLELADLAATSVYLELKWPNIEAIPENSSSSLSPSKNGGKSAMGRIQMQPCPDCGKVHKEIFEFKRWRKGPKLGKEWDLVVKPVIIRWGNLAQFGFTFRVLQLAPSSNLKLTKSSYLYYIQRLLPVPRPLNNISIMENLRPAPTGLPASGSNGAEQEANRAQEEQMRRDVMATVMDTAARERLSRISLVSPERAKQIENILLRMAQSGQLRGRLTEEQLIDLLDQMEESQGKASTKKSTIVYQRKVMDDDDFDF
ncbi:hypothetical protein BDQ12DRAFT_719544 [Crucibulum laeve]|uniref:Bacteriophage T5 Orf172 DNA-binding domain-containing protein n=1 Tax=Crucibulum laeve TaxID=68775 RepID=A0A5C3MCQ9_9AGAR|nr:hypothetical protein BDQ12DRAFT_719544 [Crucibulum laeve]